MDKEKIKEAFQKVKQDIFFLGNEISGLKLLIADMKNEIKILSKAFNDFSEKTQEKTPMHAPTHTPAHPAETPTNQQKTPTHEEFPTDKLLSKVLNRQNLDISTGNEGVPTDKQTNTQTNRHIIHHIKTQENHLEKASEILDSLEALKKELRIKIKRLTAKEMQVLSLLYQLDNEGEIVDYPLLSIRLNLTESSIRDYIGKITKKGIPIIKEKLNNKKIILHISQDLKKIASLDTILKLREI
jgi:hypothetical protein